MLWHKPFLLLIIIILSCNALIAQEPKTAFVHDIEELKHLIDSRINTQQDTVGMQAIIDSVQKEGNWEKTEYAVFFVHHDYCNLPANIFSDADCVLEIGKMIAHFKSQRIKAVYKFDLGDLFWSRMDYTRSIDLMLEAISECKALGYQNVPTVNVLFYLLSNRYYHFNNYRKCIEYAALSARYIGYETSVRLFNTWGLAYQKLERYDSAVMQFRETIRQAQISKQPVWEYIACGNLGRTYCLQNNFAEGLPLLLVDVVMDSSIENTNAAISALYMAEAFIKMRRQDSAAYYMQLSKTIFSRRWQWESKEFYSTKFGYYYYDLLSQLDQLRGYYLTALQYKDTSILHEKRYNKQFDWQLLTSTEKRIEGLEYQQDIALLDSEKKNERLQKILLLIILVSSLAIALLFINRQRLKNKKERQLAKEKEANMLLQQQQAQKELETARQQLDDLIKSFEEKERYKENITTGLLAMSEAEGKQPLPENVSKKLQELANTSLLTNEDWQMFQQRFERVYPGFFANLAITIPDISPAEERLLSLLQLKINYRQMASMLAISTESVRKAKYRLRKKLAAKGQMDLLPLLEETM